MIKDFFVSFKNNLKDKTTNPFLGTYAFVWLVRNWEVVYTIFNFNEETALGAKLAIIKSHFYGTETLWHLFENIGITFAIMFVTYILLNLSRIMVNVSEKQVKPLVYKYTSKSSVVLKEEFEKVKAEREDYRVRLNKETEEVLKLESKLKSLTERHLEREAELKSQINAFDEFALEEREKIAKNISHENFNHVFERDNNQLVSKPSIKSIEIDLELLGITNSFKDFSRRHMKGNNVSITKKFETQLKRLGLITIGSNGIELTEIGEDIAKGYLQ